MSTSRQCSVFMEDGAWGHEPGRRGNDDFIAMLSVFIAGWFVWTRTKAKETGAFLYLDVISWLESKIGNVPVQEVIRGKFLATVKS